MAHKIHKLRIFRFFLAVAILSTAAFQISCSKTEHSGKFAEQYKMFECAKSVTDMEYADRIEIAKYEGEVGRVYHDITFDYGKRNFHLPAKDGMAQFPLSGHTIDFSKGFTAPTEPYEMAAFACNPADGKMFALDGKQKQIITDNPESQKIPLPADIGVPTGMCHDGKLLWICDSRGYIHGLEVQKNKLVIQKTMRSGLPDPRGMAYDGHYYWICSKNEIARFDLNGKVHLQRRIDQEIDGLCVVIDNVWAIAYNKPEIYRYALKL